MKKNKLVAIVLAAGEGTRMKSSLPKVMHKICGKPMLDYVLEAISTLTPQRILLITGHKKELIEQHTLGIAECITQEKRLGTADAVKQAKDYLADFDGDVLVACGDTPLLTAQSLEMLVSVRKEKKAACVILTSILDDPAGYGRIVRNNSGSISRIVEQKDANPDEAKINEINTGTYCFDGKLLFESLKKVKNNNSQNEYYLTDVVEILSSEGHEVHSYITNDPSETFGINSRKQLADADKVMRMRVLDSLMKDGTTVIDPETTFIDRGVKIGRDTIIQPFTIIKGNTTIGENCEIGPNTQILNSTIADNCEINSSYITESEIEKNTQIVPFSIIKAGRKINSSSGINLKRISNL